MHSLLHVRRCLLVVSVIAAAWAVTLARTGGFLIHLGPLRLSSRDASTPALIALVCALSVYALGRAPSARTSLQEEWRWWSGRLLTGVRTLWDPYVPAMAIALIAVGLHTAQWLQAAPLWADEEMVALNLRDRSFVELSGGLWFGQSAPLGWLVVQRTLLLALGTGELNLRLLPLLHGIATVGAALWIGRRWLAPGGAALLILLCSFGEWLSFFHFELKHYSADAFWALLLPALAAWAVDDADGSDTHRRWTRWWAIAALGQWFANGALLVTPACALVLFGLILRRHGTGAAARFAVSGLLWLVSFAAHYELALRHANESSYLRTYWANALPAASMGVLPTVAWILDRLEPLGRNPGGAAFAMGLWICVIGGFAFSRRPILAGLFATVPLSAFALAGVRLVPLYERLSLWIVPALYMGIALLFDAAFPAGWHAWRARRWPRLMLGLIVASFVLIVSAGIIIQGQRRLLTTPRDSNHGLDDRAAAVWLMARRQPGDALMTTRLGWPALLWYGGMPVHTPAIGGRIPDGSVLYELSYERRGPGCERQLQELIQKHSRVLVHVGFPDVPEGFYDLLLHEFAALGTVVETRRFAHISRTAVIAVGDPAQGISAGPPAGSEGGPPPLGGCIRIRPARRW